MPFSPRRAFSCRLAIRSAFSIPQGGRFETADPSTQPDMTKIPTMRLVKEMLDELAELGRSQKHIRGLRNDLASFEQANLTNKFSSFRQEVDVAPRARGRAAIGRLNQCSDVILIENEFVRNTTTSEQQALSARCRAI